MSQRPAHDDAIVGQVPAALCAYPAFLVAYERGLFRALAEKPLTLAEVSEAVRVRQRPASAMLSIAAALGLVRLDHGRYALTEVAREYLLPESPTSWCGYFDFLKDNASLFSYESMREALVEDKPQGLGGKLFENMRKNEGAAFDFTRFMHSVSMAPALAWPSLVDLSKHEHLLDVAGGSGAHCIGAVSRWPNLRATVFDVPKVCAVAKEYAAKAGLADRIGVHSGDMWSDKFPDADVHFYSQIFHNWSVEACTRLARRSFDALPRGGLIMVHDLLFNDDRTGPFRVAATNMLMILLHADGREYSGAEVSDMLAAAGFAEIRTVPTFSAWSVVIGAKP